MTSSDLTVTVLGCSGSYAGPGAACTGFLVRSREAAVWLDAGPGTLANLQRHVALSRLSAVVLSHEHPDHWLELPVVYSAVRYYEPRGRLRVFNTVGTRLLAVDLCREADVAFDWEVVAGGQERTNGDQRWSWSRTEHYVETLACRVEVGESSFMFSSDTGPGWPLADLGSSPDLAIVESTFLKAAESDGALHLSALQAGEQASSVRAGRLVLTHLAPGQEAAAHASEAKAAFDGPVEVAEIGATYKIWPSNPRRSQP